MIELYFWTTPNGYKPLLFLEETGLEHRIVPVNISRGEQFASAFLAISPNNRMPAIVDRAPPGGGAPVSVFESGAILLYLAEKTGQFIGRLYGVLNKRLADRAFVAGDEYTIADMAAYPWIVPHEKQRQRLEDFPHLARWFAAIRARPATQRAYLRGRAINTAPTVTEESKKLLFGQSAVSVR